jgi:TRAP-type mannitol/chloroaromatic compound transport system permease small subunit
MGDIYIKSRRRDDLRILIIIFFAQPFHGVLVHVSVAVVVEQMPLGCSSAPSFSSLSHQLDSTLALQTTTGYNFSLSSFLFQN